MSTTEIPSHANPEIHGVDPHQYVPPKQDPTVVKLLGILRPKMPQFDRRFPQVNATRACFANYSDYYRCTKKLGEDAEPCKWYKTQFNYDCPTDWIAQFDEQRAEGVFPLKI